MKVGDLVTKTKGMRSGRIGVITRIYNENNDGYIILEVLSEGELLKWSSSWCESILEKE